MFWNHFLYLPPLGVMLGEVEKICAAFRESPVKLRLSSFHANVAEDIRENMIL